MGWLILGALALWYIEAHGGLGPALAALQVGQARPIRTPGIQTPVIGGGVSVTLPGGDTWHLANGDAVSVYAGTPITPDGWTNGVLNSTGQPVWLNTFTGELRAAQNF